jgi:Circadian oscillating protein COP23
MKFGGFFKILSVAGFALTATTTISEPSNAQISKFYCGVSRGVPSTLVRTPRGNKPMIRWVDSAFPTPWTPVRRCEDISARFQRFFSNGTLNFLRAGKFNGQPVLCVASYKGGPCLPSGVLVTLKSGANPSQVLQKLLDNRAGSSSDGAILLEGNTNLEVSTIDDADYFDIQKIIDASVESNQIGSVTNQD